MARENVEIVRRWRRACAALNRQDFDDAMDAMEPVDSEVEWVPPDAMPEQGVYCGPEAIKRRWAYLGGNPGELEPNEFIEAGERTFVSVRISGRGEGSGAPIEGRLYQVITTRGSRPTIIRVENFLDRDKSPRSRRALGLGDVAGERQSGAWGVRGVRHRPGRTAAVAGPGHRVDQSERCTRTRPPSWPQRGQGRLRGNSDGVERAHAYSRGLHRRARQGARDGHLSRSWTRKRNGSRANRIPHLDRRRRSHRPLSVVLPTTRGPRSRRALGVGDVGAERGGGAAASRRESAIAPSRLEERLGLRFPGTLALVTRLVWRCLLTP